MRIIFLDCDGVLNCSETTTKIPNTGYYGLDDTLLANFKELYDRSNKEEETKIVLSSSWRICNVRMFGKLEYDDNALVYLKDKFKEIGLELYDVTPDLDSKNDGIFGRGWEIKKWLDDHNDLDINNYLVLDDDYHNGFDEEFILDHWFQTYFYSNGFFKECIEPALEILNGVLGERLYYEYSKSGDSE